MWFLLGALFFCFIIATIFLPWINRSRIRILRADIDDLQDRIAALEGSAIRKKAPTKELHPWGEDLSPQPVRQEATPTPKISDEKIWPAYTPPPAKEKTANLVSDTKPGFEMEFGAKLPVWVGGIALALAGFYLVKYSIDIGLLSPSVRLSIGALFGIALLFVGHKIRKREGFANGTRIAQALSGAGIADLYICVFTATNIYHLIPTTLGFCGMAVVTATAVILSLRHGAPIALLGMVGGFLTPALMGSTEPSAPLLFGYLYVVVAGLMTVIRRQGWWTLGLLTVAASFLWVAVWLMGSTFAADDAIWLCLFMLLVLGTVFGISSYKQSPDIAADTVAELSQPVPLLNNIVALAALGLFGCVMTKSGYGLMEWGLFYMLSAGTIAMAYFRHQAYSFLPWASMVMNGLMILTWPSPAPENLAVLLLTFSLLYVACGYLLQKYSGRPFYWGSTVVGASTGFYVLAYTLLHDRLVVPGGIYFWGALAFAFATVGLYCLVKIMRTLNTGHPEKQHLLSVYAVGITAFVSLGLMIVLDRFYFTAALAAEVLALAWISTRVDIPNLRRIAGLVAVIFIFLTLPQLFVGVNVLMRALFDSRISSQDIAGGHPLIQMGLPALLFLAAALQLLRKEDGRLVEAFETIGIIFAAIAGRYLVYHIMYPGQNTLQVHAGFVERGLITNIVFLSGFACLWIGNRFGRQVFFMAGLVISLMAVFRVCYLDLVLHNPLWHSNQNVGGLPLLNGLLLTYGMPALWIMHMARTLPSPYKENWGRELGILAFLFSFVLVSFEVRQFYHGGILTGRAENLEVYTYSAIWLLFGLALLFFGTLRNIKIMRVASLCLMVLTVGKVFLYDASELTGLFRVFSFLGLGLSLLGLSWFYSRFVFPKRKE